MSSAGNSRPILGAIEAGGTKFVLAVGSSSTSISETETIPTTSPQETLPQVRDWFARRGPIAAIGIGSFGPIEVDPASGDWGRIGRTPKTEWIGCDIAGYFARELAVPVGLDTDVNAAAMAEFRQDALAGVTAPLAYVTVGTGIGGGVVVGGRPLHGASHPEMGHIAVRRHALDRDFAGCCPYHGDCLEGLASGTAIRARWGASLDQLPLRHDAHAIIADYLAQLCLALSAMIAPATIVLGGGVMNTPRLLAAVEQRHAELAAGYFAAGVARSIRRPALGSRAGIVGALLLAQDALRHA